MRAIVKLGAMTALGALLATPVLAQNLNNTAMNQDTQSWTRGPHGSRYINEQQNGGNASSFGRNYERDEFQGRQNPNFSNNQGSNNGSEGWSNQGWNGNSGRFSNEGGNGQGFSENQGFNGNQNFNNNENGTSGMNGGQGWNNGQYANQGWNHGGQGSLQQWGTGYGANRGRYANQGWNEGGQGWNGADRSSGGCPGMNHGGFANRGENNGGWMNAGNATRYGQGPNNWSNQPGGMAGNE